MDSKKWGPSAWTFLHYITLNYPEYPSKDEKLQYKIFFESLQYILPCPECREHYQKHLVTTSLTDKVLSCRRNLIMWLIDLHNIVNKSGNKPIVSYSEALELYD